MDFVFLTLEIGTVAIGLTAAGLYTGYRRSPAVLWTARIRLLNANLKSKFFDAQQAASRLDADRASAIEKLRTERFNQQIQACPVEALDEFPGIGPQTIRTLRENSFRTLSDFAAGDSSTIPGIGDKRRSAIQLAVQTLLQRQSEIFESGDSRFRREFEVARQSCMENFDRLRLVSNVRIEEYQRALKELSPLAPLTEQVTFWNFVLMRRLEELLPGVDVRSFPQTVEALDAAADAKASLQWRSSRPPSELQTKKHEPAALKPGDPFADALSRREKSVIVEDASARVAPLTQKSAADGTPAPTIDFADAARRKKIDLVLQIYFAAARADGRIAAGETAAIRRLSATRWGADPATVEFVESTIRDYSKNVVEIDRALVQLSEQTPNGELHGIHRDLEVIVAATSGVNEKEAAFLRRVAASWTLVNAAALPAGGGSDQAPAGAPVADEAAAVDEASLRAALDVNAETPLSADLVRRQYRLLLERLNPERARTFGADIERTVAEKRRAATAAAEILLARFGFKLVDEPAAPPPSDELRNNPDLDAIFGV